MMTTLYQTLLFQIDLMEMKGTETTGDSISYAAVNVDGSDEANDKVVVDLSSGADAQGYYDADIYQDGVVTNTDKL